ncbi:Clp protease ClpP [Romboutsia sedimentorum]|uniref:head maturation protease, ClpP-related n=1 Tax=Romboutsia sedimentorum TaxID=1368474 RepID=UPI0024DE418B|nr:head maturation protease, ClpP-related [Romboutsia sedimentorum]MDK2587457.1 Clp protease ClpP [Romboutsia sedimentorum]
MKKKKDNLKDFLQIKNQTETSADLYFYGDIVSSYWGAWDDTDQYPESVKNFLDEVKGKDLNIYISSAGGSVFAGMAIYNMLKRHAGFKTVYVDAVAASISSVIALAGDKVIIPSNAFFMIHKPWVEVQGNSITLREQADVLDKIEEGILNVYSENLKEGVDIETIKELVNAETWLTGLDASKYFDIEVSDSIDAVASTSEYLNKFTDIPKDLKVKNVVDKEIENNNEIEKLLLELDLM